MKIVQNINKEQEKETHYKKITRKDKNLKGWIDIDIFVHICGDFFDNFERKIK